MSKKEFEELKKEEIFRIQEQDDLFKKIDQNARQKNLFSDTQWSAIKNAVAENAKIKTKLETETIEVAIVGLEGSGKSSFGNALAERRIFPTGESERCTYTTTELRNGDNP